MSRFPCLLVFSTVLFSAVMVSPTASAQLFEPHSYLLGGSSSFETGCTGPSPCDCLIQFVGPIEGSIELIPLLPPLGPIFEFGVEFSGTVSPSVGASLTVSGSGLYQIDVNSELHQMTLDLSIDGGTPRTFESVGFVAGATSFPGTLDIAIYNEIDTCLFDGLVLQGVELTFLRGDTNNDQQTNLLDALRILNVLFLGAAPFECEKSADIDDNGSLALIDAIALLNFLFSVGPAPSAPHPDCGLDTTNDTLTCILGCP